jgi:hypothetical protein
MLQAPPHCPAPPAPISRLLLHSHKSALRATAAFWRMALQGDVAFRSVTECLKKIEATRRAGLCVRA